MKPAPFLLGTAVLFWGWQCNFFWFAFPMALGLELPHWFERRWALSDRDFERIADLSGVLLLGVTIFQFDAHGFHAIFPLLQVFPIVLFPLVLAQRVSTRAEISYAALFLSVRRALRKGKLTAVGGVSIDYPFLVVLVVAASAGAELPPTFLVGFVLLLSWALLSCRPRSSGLSAWALCVMGGLVLGSGISAGAFELRRSLEPLALQWFQERLWGRRDPYQSRTAIGYLGRLKLSHSIVARVRGGPSPPPLLRQAVYQTFSRHSWLAVRASFQEIESVGGGTVWDLSAASEVGRHPDLDPRMGRPNLMTSVSRPQGAASKVVEIRTRLPGGRGILMLPADAATIQGLNVDYLESNGLGTVKVNSGPPVIDFRARYGERDLLSSTPMPGLDTQIPERDRAFFEAKARELNLAAARPTEAVQRVREYFQDGFTYSLGGSRRGRAYRPLPEFLTETRSGHCEYYASATVLLLRAAGIPARYVTGYAVTEFSDWEQAFVVRRRHAHAWASAHVGGKWIDIDTTPAGWAALESLEAPWWLGAHDAVSWMRHRFNEWRYSEGEVLPAKWLIVSALALSGGLAWRIVRRTRTVVETWSLVAPPDWRGSDSPFYRLEEALGDSFEPRRPGETWKAWLARARAAPEPPPDLATLETALELHYRYRFDPKGLRPEEFVRLGALVARWLANRNPDRDSAPT